tara:strand:- start:1188 stop:1334 length:147 start_codon:yes stop_codon:yes gene_type:complete
METLIKKLNDLRVCISAGLPAKRHARALAEEKRLVKAIAQARAAAVSA